MPEREPERPPVALAAVQQLVVVLDEQVAVAGLEDRRGRPGERRQIARRAPQRRHVVGQAGRCRQPEAAAGIGRQVVQPAGQLAAPRHRPPRPVVGADAELEPGVAGERRPPLAVGPRPPGELPALTRRHRAQLAPLCVDAAYQHVRRLPAAADAQRDEQAGGAVVDERARLRRAQAGRERADFDGAQRPVRFDPHPRDAAVRGDPRAAAIRRHEEADGAREAGRRGPGAAPRARPAGSGSRAVGRRRRSARGRARPAGRRGSTRISTSRRGRGSRPADRPPSAPLRGAGCRCRRSCRRRRGAAAPRACRRCPPAPSGTDRAPAGGPCDSRRRRRSGRPRRD